VVTTSCPQLGVIYDAAVEADYAVELGADDPTLEIPWTAPDGGPRYHDLKRKPELLAHIEEARRAPALAEFLAAINSASIPLHTAKCDVWTTSEMHPEDEIFAAKWKFGSYVDLFFAEMTPRLSFDRNEALAKRLAALLKRVPEIPASAEFVVRRCFFHSSADQSDSGFYITFYLAGFGADEEHAQRQWGIALKLVENAIRQACTEMP